MQNSAPDITVIFDMDSTLLSIETLDRIIETALRRSLGEDRAAEVMEEVERQMAAGMSGSATLAETIPARIKIAKDSDAPVRNEDFAHVVEHISESVTPAILETLAEFCSKLLAPVRIIVVSGGPQECVDEAVAVLRDHLSTRTGIKIPELYGKGNKIVINAEGNFDAEQSRIRNSKVETIRGLVKDPTRAIMIGDGATDLEVYEKRAANYFLAYGGWVKRDVLFKKFEKSPYYLKVESHEEFPNALRTAINDILKHE